MYTAEDEKRDREIRDLRMRLEKLDPEATYLRVLPAAIPEIALLAADKLAFLRSIPPGLRWTAEQAAQHEAFLRIKKQLED